MSLWKKKKPKKKPAAKPRPKQKPQTALAPARPVPKFEPKPFTPPKMPEAGYAVRMDRETPSPHTSKAEKPKPKPKLDPEKDFLKTFRELTYRHRGWDIWNDFVVMAACALSNPVDKSHYEEREARYLRTIRKYDKQEQEMFPVLFAHTVIALELEPEQDFLGRMYTLLDLYDKKRNQIFTPYQICELMAEVTMSGIVEEVHEKGFITINDPCCGAGATLIAGVHSARRSLEKAGLNFQNHVLVSAQDIDETVALMCYIQLSLLGAAAYVKVGNTLTDPIAEGDSLENYWFTPMYFSNVWAMRRAVHQMDKLLQKGAYDGP